MVVFGSGEQKTDSIIYVQCFKQVWKKDLLGPKSYSDLDRSKMVPSDTKHCPTDIFATCIS